MKRLAFGDIIIKVIEIRARNEERFTQMRDDFCS